MTIEKISDNQIRATLTRSDLEDRHIRLAELVMGTEKARDLFKDLMQQAYIEHGFETDEKFPLMIEAIPVSMDCLILVITRVDDPEEFEKRSDRFKKLISHDINMNLGEDHGEDYEEASLIDPEDMDEEGDADGSENDIGTQMLQFFNDMLRKKFGEESQSESDRSSEKEAASAESSADRTKAGDSKPRRASSGKGAVGKERKPVKPAPVHIFSFPDMNAVSSCCALIEPFYQGTSALYKNPFEKEYLLVLRRPSQDDGAYDRSCRLASDFGFSLPQTEALESYFREHYRIILSEDAVAGLSSLA